MASSRVFSAEAAKGGQEVLDASKTAVLFIEYQNEFVTEGGKLHDGVKAVMESTGMLENSVAVAKAARAAGAKVMHIAITFSEDASDNPNKGLGILKGCADGKLFVRDTWGAEFCEQMAPQPGDIIVEGKRGLDSFPDTTLEAELRGHGIENLAIAGFLTNCCVESTMRTAFEKGYNTLTLVDCTATTSEEGQKAAVGGTFGMFSTPITADEFTAKLTAASVAEPAAEPAVAEKPAAEKAAAPASAVDAPAVGAPAAEPVGDKASPEAPKRSFFGKMLGGKAGKAA